MVQLAGYVSFLQTLLHIFQKYLIYISIVACNNFVEMFWFLVGFKGFNCRYWFESLSMEPIESVLRTWQSATRKTSRTTKIFGQ